MIYASNKQNKQNFSTKQNAFFVEFFFSTFFLSVFLTLFRFFFCPLSCFNLFANFQVQSIYTNTPPISFNDSPI